MMSDRELALEMLDNVRKCPTQSPCTNCVESLDVVESCINEIERGRISAENTLSNFKKALKTENGELPLLKKAPSDRVFSTVYGWGTVCEDKSLLDVDDIFVMFCNHSRCLCYDKFGKSHALLAHRDLFNSPQEAAKYFESLK